MQLNSKKRITIINYILSSIAWLLSLLFLLFNLFGLFKLWQLTGLGVIFYVPIPIISSIIAILISIENYIKLIDKKYVFMNCLSLIITIIVILLSIFVYANWFWWKKTQQVICWVFILFIAFINDEFCDIIINFAIFFINFI